MNTSFYKNYKLALVMVTTVAVFVSGGLAFRLVQAGKEIDSLKSELQSSEIRNARLKILASRAHDAPVKIMRLKSGQGRFVVINQADSDLPMTIRISGRQDDLVDIPKASGWLVSHAKPGDQVEIACAGFDPILVTAH